MKTAGIYIHIPFCANKCIYCDYYSLEKREQDIPYFVEMLMREIELSEDEMEWYTNQGISILSTLLRVENS